MTKAATQTPFTETRRFKVMRAVVGTANPLVKALLGSRFGARMNESLLLLRFKGRTSGTWHSTPVGYVREGRRIVVVTSPTYRWWKNVREGAEVEARAGGQWFAAHARVVSAQDPAFDELLALQVTKRGPNMLRGFGLAVDDAGHLDDAAKADADRYALIVEVALGEELDGPTA